MSGEKPCNFKGSDTLYDLYLEIQSAFGWDKDHLFSFYMSNRLGEAKSEYSGNPIGRDPSSIEAKPSGTAAQTEIQTLELKKGNQFKYFFYYGDNLFHTVEVLEVSKRCDVNETYPFIVEKVGEPPHQYEYGEE
ncbi:unnamed protein product [marine sediment metagenome]|uniref:Plasmid pRiA4b Orf3-like domain-containing protein n=1 Tax=marine sediment metagenome TaxID=412755 RepID=X1JNF6_9ZZZZ